MDDFDPNAVAQVSWGPEAPADTPAATAPAQEKQVDLASVPWGGPAEPSDLQKKLQGAVKQYSEKAEEYWGPGSESYTTERIPVLSAVEAVGYYTRLHGAAKRIEEGKQSDDDIYLAAQHIAKQKYESERSIGQKTFDIATQIPGIVGEWTLTGGALPAAKKLAEASLGKVAASYLTRGLLRTALSSTTASAIAQQSVSEEPGKDGEQPTLKARDLPEAVARGALQSAVTNTIFEGSSIFSAKQAGTWLTDSLKSTGLAVGGAQAAKEALYWFGLNGAPSELHRLATDDDKMKALGELLPELIVFGGLEAFLHAVPNIKGKATELKRRGINPEGPIGQRELLKEAEQLAAQGPEPGIDRPTGEERSGPEAAPATPPEAATAAPEPAVEPKAPEAPQTARQRADSMEKSHLDLMGRLQDARRSENAAKDMVSKGFPKQQELKEAKAIRIGLEKELGTLERDLDAARVQAAAESPPERRKDLAQRRRVADMTPEERAQALLTSEKTGLPNRRAFDESEGSPAVGMSDADGLKAFNDTHGYEAGDQLLRAKAAALKAAGLNAFHDKGDEFLYRGESPEGMKAKLERARQMLRDTEIAVKMKDGTIKRFKGADFSYGTATELSGAETGLKGHKAEREALGERARGELRGIQEVGPEPSSGDQGGTPPVSAGETPTTRPPVSRLDRLRQAQAGQAGQTPRPAPLTQLRQAARPAPIQPEASPQPLTPIEQRVLSERAIVSESGQPQSFRAIGKKLGMSHERVRQHEENALAKQKELQSVSARAKEEAEQDVLRRWESAEGRGEVPFGDPAIDPANLVVKSRRLETEVDRFINRSKKSLVEFEKEVTDAGGKLTPEREAYWADRIDREEEGRDQGRGAPPEEPAIEPPAVRAEPENPSQPVAPAVRLRRAKMESMYPDVFTSAREAGLDIGDLHGAAENIVARSKEGLQEHNELLTESFEALKRRGVTRQAIKKAEDVAAVPHLDDVLSALGEERVQPMLERGEDLQDGFLRILKEGNKEPKRFESAYGEAVNDVIEKTKRQLGRQGVRESVAEEAIRSGKASEEAGEVGDAFEEPGGDASFDFREFIDKPGTRGAGVAAERAERVDPLEQIAKEIVKDESGAANVSLIAERAKALKDHLSQAVVRLRDNIAELSGQMAPRTTRESRETGEALTRLNAAATYARVAAPVFIDKVMGENATQADRRLYGTALYEMRFRYARQALLRAGETDAAAAVKTFIGQQNSPLATEADFRRVISSPEFKRVIENFKREFVPEMDRNYRGAQGLDPTDPIDSITQMPGLPFNAKAVQPGEAVPEGAVVMESGRGNLKNVKIRPSPFAKRATLASDAYDTDLGAVIENSLSRSVVAARKAEFYRTAAENGIVQWAKPGQQLDGAKEVPFSKPPKGTQEAKDGDVAYVKNEAYDEVRRALAVDKPYKIPVVTPFLNAITKVALASTAEATYHAKNNITFLMKPGVSPIDFMKNAAGVINKDPALRERIVELARIGAMKDRGFESPQAFASSKLNPLNWMGKFLDVLDSSMRLTGEDAFNRLQRSGRVEGTETNKRDFINQLGQYNKRAQNELVVLLRDTGLGPFATAGTNYYMQGMKSLTGGHGLKATSASADVGLRAEMIGKTVGVLTAAALANYLLWKRVDGDDKTPLGAIKVGEKEGRTGYFDITNLTGLTRGMRQTGLLALAEGQRKGSISAKVEDKAIENAWHSLLHPAVGPGVQFLYTAVTGKNTFGTNIAGKPKPNETQHGKNVEAALANANPAYSTLTGADRPKDKTPLDEKLWKLLGPFGVKFRRR